MKQPAIFTRKVCQGNRTKKDTSSADEARDVKEDREAKKLETKKRMVPPMPLPIKTDNRSFNIRGKGWV